MNLLDLVPVDTNLLTKFLDKNADSVKSLVTQIASGLDLPTAHMSPKLFNLKSKYGKGTVIKILCAVLKSFCDSIKASKTMDTIDIIECAELLEEKYSHDSMKDIILALKNAKLKGTKFYNAIDVSVIMAICSEYFEEKTKWLESRHEQTKLLYSDSNNETMTVLRGMEEGAEKKQRDLDRKRHSANQEILLERDRIKLQLLENEINKEKL